MRVWRGMINGSNDSSGNRLAPPFIAIKSVADPKHASRDCHLLWRCHRSANTLRFSSRSRGVNNGAGQLLRVPGCWFKRLTPQVPVGIAGLYCALGIAHAIGQLDRFRHWNREDQHVIGNDLPHAREQIGMNHQSLDARIIKEIFRFGRRVMPIDSHRIGAHQRGTATDLKERKIVAQINPYAIPWR